MKGLITTLNSKFTHSALSIRYLKKFVEKKGYEIDLEEYTINHRIEYIVSEIYKGKYDVITFSCYIWNYSETIKVCRSLKKLIPNIRLILGGPEVTYDPEVVLEDYDFIDYICLGEGELVFSNLYSALLEGRSPNGIKGVAYRVNQEIVVNEEEDLIKNLDIIPFPYEESLEGLDNRIIYYESSRGCPFNCQYCLSSTLAGVRFFSLPRVKKDLQFFLDKKLKQVKFVDRTFNANKKHAFEIIKFLNENNNGITNFHFEITASLLDEEIINYLKDVPVGLFQFEVGVQSTYEDTILEIDRQVDFEKVKESVLKVSAFENIHLHLDLIVGLPFENYERFKLSFNDVYRLKPEKLQLGFLKLLKGSGLWRNQEQYGYVYSDEPPYEIYFNKYISFDEVLLFKEVEELVESYYNSHRFDMSMDYVIQKMFNNSPIDFYIDFFNFWEEKGLHHVSHKSNTLYKILLNYYEDRQFSQYKFFCDLVKIDYYKNNDKQVYGLFEEVTVEDFTNRCHLFLKDENNVEMCIPNMVGKPAKYIIRRVHFEIFSYDILKAVQSGYKDIYEVKNVILFNYDIDHKVFTRSLYYTVNI